MINKDSIAKMKDGVILINAARGALVDTKDLIEAVESGKIGSVGTDCCEGEDEFIRTDRKYDDLVVNHDYIILKSFQNTIVTPHVAFSQIRLCLTWLSLQLRVLCSLQLVKTHH